jgi:hypothetical protein
MTATPTEDQGGLRTYTMLLEARDDENNRTIAVLHERITELGELLTSLGHPPQSLTLHLDEVARANARAVADARTG